MAFSCNFVYGFKRHQKFSVMST